MNYSPDLAQLLISHAQLVNYQAVYDKKYSSDQMQAYTSIECHLLVSFLMGVEEYAYDYTLPTTLLNEMVEKIPAEEIRKVGHYMTYNVGSPVLAKQLLDKKYLQSNVIIEMGEDGEPKLGQ
jgi:hypothetical protein